MRIESSVLSVSWIPSEAISGLPRQVFDLGITHYDDPPPDEISAPAQLEELRAAGRFRFANRLNAWIEVEGGRVVDAGYAGGGLMGITTVSLAGRSVRFDPVALPDRQAEPEILDGAARFAQTAGGRAPIPAPRHVKHPPFVQLRPPDVWTTLALTIRFPRHWIYDSHGHLAAKAGLADFKEWYRTSFGRHTPWGDRESPAYVTAVETALERQLSTTIMRSGSKPKVRTLKKGQTLTEQGAPGDELYLLLDGLLVVVVDDEPVAELGPSARSSSTAAAPRPCGPRPNARSRWQRRISWTRTRWRSSAAGTTARKADPDRGDPRAEPSSESGSATAANHAPEGG